MLVACHACMRSTASCPSFTNACNACWIIRSRWRYWLAKPHMDGVLSHQKPSFGKRRAGAVNVQRNDYGLGLCGQVKSAFLKGNIVPSFERVPSGYTMTEMPRFKVETSRSTDCLAAVGFERSMNTVSTRSLSNPRIVPCARSFWTGKQWDGGYGCSRSIDVQLASVIGNKNGLAWPLVKCCFA